MKSLEGKVAIITGSTSGIGARTAELFVAEGARVVIVGRREDRGQQMARALGETARFIRADVTDEGDVAAMIACAVAEFGRLDCLVNNAGIGSGYQEIAAVDLKQFDAVIAVHVRGPLAAMKHAVPIMEAQGGGSIINMASVNGSRAGLGGHYYSAAKAALIHLTRCAAVELGEKSIRVNSISPGPIATGAFGKGGGADDADASIEIAKAAIADVVLHKYQPLPYVGIADDIAQAALFLAGDASRLVSGVDLVVDGGISAGWPIAAVREDRARFLKHFNRTR
ncbi:MAG TPA: SDR family oxidoreductase [Rhizomicrobium sp.]|nr:SDR family oxidoreductase [Rhizomicrobium sp.]